MNNEKLMEASNIVCNDPDNPYTKYVASQKVDKSQDGYLYQQALSKLCNDPLKDLVIGVDVYANLTW